MVSVEQSTREINTRPTTPIGSTPQSYDLVCIGFGPAQIATAIANREAAKPYNILFLERKPSFSWHPSSHLPRSRMENAFVYDLATTRNPRSAFSYVNYLLAQNRLVEFANSDRLNPLREEFEDYLRWCADKFQEQVRFHSEVVQVTPEQGENCVCGWNITVKDKEGATYLVRTRNIAAPSPSPRSGPKHRPLTSINFEAGQRIIPMEDYIARRNDLRDFREPRLDVAVVGSGQQTIEILDDLLSCHRLGNITVVTENEALAPLRILGGQPPAPQPRLCSIWAKPACESQSTISGSTELVQSIYTRAYEKQLKGGFALRVVIGSEPGQHLSKAGVIIAEQTPRQLSKDGLFQGLDLLVLGCRQKGESLEEVQFKRGAVADDCRMWLLAANSDGGRSLAKDIAVRAGEVVRALSGVSHSADGNLVINARM